MKAVMHTTDGVILREATLVDADAIGLLHRISLQAGIEYGVPPSALLLAATDRGREWREWLRAKGLGRATGVVLVADSLHGSIGFACAAPRCPPLPASDWELTHLTVMHAHQGQGVGRRLLHTCLERAAQAGAHSVTLTTPAEARWNPFFAACGGTTQGEEDIRYLGVTLRVERFSLPLPATEAAKPTGKP